MAPRARSTSRVSISRIAFDRALTSIAHIPSTIGGRRGSVAAERSEWEPFGEGVDDLVKREMDRGDVEKTSDDLNIDIRERGRLGVPLGEELWSRWWFGK